MGLVKCDDVEVKRLFLNVVTTKMAVPELNNVIQTEVATIANIEELKPKQK